MTAYGNNFVGDQIDSVSQAIEHSGREMVYSLSPGNYGPPEQHAELIHNYTQHVPPDWRRLGQV